MEHPERSRLQNGNTSLRTLNSEQGVILVALWSLQSEKNEEEVERDYFALKDFLESRNLRSCVRP
jgi:hypothetical protein